MVERSDPSSGSCSTRIEPDDRLVVLTRTMHSQHRDFEAAWRDADGRDPDVHALGAALYRHRSVFRGASDVPVWSHLELRYFRGVVPASAVHAFVSGPLPAGGRLLRAEILLTTPSSFTLPRGWRGSTDRPGRRSSLEYIHVRPDCLDAYRNIMRRHIGPASAHLVAMGRVETFRAMETAAVLYHDPSLTADWNQIHLCEVDADSFEGFGPAFDAALRAVAPDGGFASVFAGLDAVRSIPRWTFNDVVTATDSAIGRLGSVLSSIA